MTESYEQMKMKQFWGNNSVASEIEAIAWELKRAIGQQAEKDGHWKNLTIEQQTMIASLIDRLQNLHSNTVDYVASQVYHNSQGYVRFETSVLREQVEELDRKLRIAEEEREYWRSKRPWWRKIADYFVCIAREKLQ